MFKSSLAFSIGIYIAFLLALISRRNESEKCHEHSNGKASRDLNARAAVFLPLLELSNTERCWHVDICDRGAFWNYRTSELNVVILKSAKFINVYTYNLQQRTVWFYRMQFGRKDMDDLDRPNLHLLQGVFDSRY